MIALSFLPGDQHLTLPQQILPFYMSLYRCLHNTTSLISAMPQYLQSYSTTIYCKQCFIECIQYLTEYWNIESNNAELLGFFYFCNIFHKKCMEIGHNGSEAGHSFLHIFPVGKIYFSASPTLSISGLLYLYFHTSTCNTISCLLLLSGPSMPTPCWEYLSFWKPLN